MKISITPSLSQGVLHLHDALIEIDEKISSTLIDKSYGEDVLELYVGIICGNSKYVEFYLPLNNRYIDKHKKYKKNNQIFEFNKMLEYEIIVNYDDVINKSINDAILYIYKEVIESFDLIKGKHKKIKDFDTDQLAIDLMNVLKKCQVMG